MSEPMIERIVRVIAANHGHAMKQNDIVQKLLIEENGGGGVITDALKERVACTVNGALYSERGKRLLVNDNGHFSLNGTAMAAEEASFRKGRGGTPRADGKVFWSDAEREQVAQRLAELRRGDMKSRIGTLFRKAQEVLPESRRRRLVSAPLMKFLSERVTQLLAGEKVVVEQNPPQILEVVVERPPDYARLFRETSTPDLMALLTERFIEGVQSALVAAQKGEAPTKIKVHSASCVREAPPPPPRTRVGILGLAGEREHVLQKASHLSLDIVFLDGNHHHTPARADFYIIHKTAAHAWHDRLKSQVSHSRVFFADGGITEIVRLLHDIHARQKPA